MRLVVTGGAGFIGSALVRHLVLFRGDRVCTIDKLTYSGNLLNLEDVAETELHEFHQIDLCDADALRACILGFEPDGILHLAAESHVDRSIDGPGDFIQTNIVGTFNLLQIAREYAASKPNFRLLHVSTDEVFGSLGESGRFSESSPYQPRSPYSASKAAADHLARAWHATYGTPVIVTNCSNNYGPHQFPEKLVPLVVLNAINDQEIPVYGDGLQVRDWLYVEDHVEGLRDVLATGTPGESYNLGGDCELTNLEVVHAIVDEVARQTGADPNGKRQLITFVDDRPGHDRRYAIDSSHIRSTVGWQPRTPFTTGIARTVTWYLENETWCERVSKVYTRVRLGLG